MSLTNRSRGIGVRYLTTTKRRKVGRRRLLLGSKLSTPDRRADRQLWQKHYAHPLLELATLFTEFGLGVHIKDLTTVTGYSEAWFRHRFGSQRNVLRELVGDTVLETFERTILIAVKNARDKLLEEHPPSKEWFDIWDKIRENAKPLDKIKAGDATKLPPPAIVVPKDDDGE